jgi:hypothetical protein
LIKNGKNKTVNARVNIINHSQKLKPMTNEMNPMTDADENFKQ